MTVVVSLFVGLLAAVSLAQVRVPVHTGGAGMGPIGGVAGGAASIPREPLRTSLEVRTINTPNLGSAAAPNIAPAVEARTAAPVSGSAMMNDSARVVSMPAYDDEPAAASGDPPPPPEPPADGDDGGDDDDDDDDEDDDDGDQADELYSSESTQTHEQSSQQAAEPKQFPWGRVVLGVIVTVCVLGYFARE